jgi:hypothetical protein
MSAEGTRSSDPPGRSAQTLQDVIVRVAEQSAGQPISVVRDRVVQALRDNGFTAPSKSWVDAVAREAVHGQAYAVSLETLAGHALATAEDKRLEDAPADLPVTSATAAGPERTLSTSGAEVPPRDAGSTRSRTRLLLALAVVVVGIAVYRRRGSRRTSGDADV